MNTYGKSPLFRPYISNIYTYMSVIIVDDTRTPIDIQLNDCGNHSFSFFFFLLSIYFTLLQNTDLENYKLHEIAPYLSSFCFDLLWIQKKRKQKHWRSFGLNKAKTACFMISLTYVLTPFINTIEMSGVSLIVSFDKNDKIVKCFSGKLFRNPWNYFINWLKKNSKQKK